MKKGIITFIMCMVCNHWCIAQKIYPKADSLLKLLETYHSDAIKRVQWSDFNPKENVSKEVKQKLLFLLKREWADEEIKVKVDNYFADVLYIYLDNIPEGSSKKANDIYKQRFPEAVKNNNGKIDTHSREYLRIYNSVIVKGNEAVIKSLKEETAYRIRISPVPDEIVLSAAAANITEAMPLLKKDLDHPPVWPCFNQRVAKLALAALGDTSYQKMFIEQHKYCVAKAVWDSADFYNDLEAIKLIKSQESIAMLGDWMDTARVNNTSTGDSSIRYHSADFINEIVNTIANKDFRKGLLTQTPQSGDDNINSQQILYVKKWLIENKGRYEFD